ncbi:MAG: UDP-2,4-diacetamido-2,4,6-trideoxy-beta-L-altropyranose hydrolase [Negativicutes bacterium]|nr:UDP-2,4-diacetamido-2,4,6-trideoxy-beta-L-altropyranose hydrolase [Negativicutes bacterium]
MVNSGKQVFIRADASVFIGSGHIMRCLSLAKGLQDRGCTVYFGCCEWDGNLCDFIESKGYKVFKLNIDEDSLSRFNRESFWRLDAEKTAELLVANQLVVDWLIVDHYQLDQAWEKFLRPFVRNIMVIDDLASRSHDCELLLDQNLTDNMNQRYVGLIPGNCQTLLGPQYVLLRPSFSQMRKHRQGDFSTIRRVLVFFGGSDAENETSKAIEAIKIINDPSIKIDVVVGASNPHRHEIEEICSQLAQFEFYCQIDNMAELMVRADLALGAGGSATWERCCVGLPSIVAVMSEDQLALTQAVADLGATINLGWVQQLSPADYAKAIERLDKHMLLAMSQRGMHLVDGKGCDRVVSCILENWV